MSKSKNRANNRFRFEDSERKQDEKRFKVNHRRQDRHPFAVSRDETAERRATAFMRDVW